MVYFFKVTPNTHQPTSHGINCSWVETTPCGLVSRTWSLINYDPQKAVYNKISDLWLIVLAKRRLARLRICREIEHLAGISSL